MSKDYETRATSWHVLPKGKGILDELVTTISIDDESGGEFVTVAQMAMPDSRKVGFTPEEWPVIRSAIDHAISQCRAENGAEAKP